MPILFGAVTDDDAGATEVAGTLADRGMRPILIPFLTMDELWRPDFERFTGDADAVIIPASCRFAHRDIAYEQTRRAVRLLHTLDPQLLHVRYSSSLDSDAGNIGYSVDAAMDETHADFTIALPDLSRNGQSSSAKLMAQFQAQSKRRVGLVPSADIAQGIKRIRESLATLRAEAVEFAVLDFASEEQLPNICQAISDLRLVTGSSVLAMHLPTSWTPLKPVYPQRRNGGRGFLVVAGSHSPLTQTQNKWLATHHAVSITLDALDLATGAMPDSVLTPISEELASGGTCLLQVSSATQALEDYYREQNKTGSEAIQAVTRSLATFVRDVMTLITPEGLIVAGEETASILWRVLGFGALAVGPSIEPGIPVCVTLSGSALPVVVKPADAGSETFYRKAIETIRSLEYLDTP